jgi:hypothetical protein
MIVRIPADASSDMILRRVAIDRNQATPLYQPNGRICMKSSDQQDPMTVIQFQCT